MELVVVNASDLRIRHRDIMERVKFKGERFLVQTFKQPTAVIISVEEYEKLTKTKVQGCEDQSKKRILLVDMNPA